MAEVAHEKDRENPAVAIREAATIVLLRDGAAGVEALMLLRSPAVEFSPSAYVFPGGAVDASDRAPELAGLCVGRTDDEASAALGLPTGGLAFWLAAVRECFEEAGVLLVRDRSGRPISFADAGTAARYQSYRRRMNAGELDLLDLCRTEGLTIDAGAIHYLAHWLTPPGAPRRYDTRFLVAAAPVGQEPLHDDYEAVASLWITPRQALDRNAAGEYELIRPTFETLVALDRFHSCAEVLDAIGLMGQMPEFQPRMGPKGDGVRVLLPGDGGWDAAARAAGNTDADNEDAGNEDAGNEDADNTDADNEDADNEDADREERQVPEGPPVKATAAGEPAGSRSKAEVEIANSAAVAPMPPGTGDLAPGVVTNLTPLVRRIVAPNPTLMTGPGTNTYLVGDPSGRLAVVDPGPDLEAHLDRIAEVGAGRIDTIVVTHTHQDHSPGVVGLVQRTGATTVGFDARDDFAPDVSAGDGWVLRGDGWSLRAVHTPGHASNHLCWLLAPGHLLFSGDHVMDGSTVVIAPPDGDMAAYLDQLERLRALDLWAIAPGHGALITDPDRRLDDYLVHRRARERQVEEVLHGSTVPITVTAIVDTIYADTPEALRPVARYSVWAHLRKLATEGRAATGDPDDVDAEWRATADA